VAGVAGGADGTGTAAQFYGPQGLAIDGSGNLYVADTDNFTIRLGYFAATPAITVQPQSQRVAAGHNVRFSVTASGKPAPTCQWYFNGTAISGATNSSFTLTRVHSTNAGDYSVTVSNRLGSVTSNKATLSASPPSSSGGGDGGGGGAPSLWFYGAPSLLVAFRRGKVRRLSPED
jgi:glycogen debranching enzyme